MSFGQEQLNAGIDAIAAIDANFARALGNAGYPPPRIRERGYTTLLRTIVGQQVSVAAANSIWNKLEAAFGEGCPAEVMAAAEFDALRACGLSGQKQGYSKSLAQLVLDAGRVDARLVIDAQLGVQLGMVVLQQRGGGRLLVAHHR